MLNRLIITILTCTVFNLSNAQEMNINALFLKDSIYVGEEVPLSISLMYLENSDVILPDSTTDFSPFVFKKLQWFPSKTQNNQLKDSVIYYLSTFELDSTQSVQLPFYQIIENDTLKIDINSDSVYLKFMVSTIPDSLSDIKLIENTNYYSIEPPFNTAFAVVGVIMFIASLIIAWALFGSKIIAWWKIRKMNKEYHRFKEKYENFMGATSSTSNISEVVESALFFWKRYMESLEGVPYRKLSTPEIRDLLKEEELINTLSVIDKAIYSNKNDEALKQELVSLQKYTDNIFHRRIENIRNGISN